FGMQLRQKGYRRMGAQGEAPWEGEVLPLSVVANVGAQSTRVDSAQTGSGDRTRRTQVSFEQNSVEFHSAGTLAPRVSFRMDADFEGVEGPLLSGMAWAQFDNLGKSSAANLKVGIFDADIPYLADSRRTTLAEYLSPVTLDGRG